MIKKDMNFTRKIFLSDIYSALKKIKLFIRRTPLDYSRYYSRLSGAHVYLKCENLQKTGSFKLRGALNAMLSLSQEEKEKGIITASAGNHAQGIGFGSQFTGTPATIIVPKNTPQTKIDAIRSYGVDLRIEGEIFDDAENKAIEYAKMEKKSYISAYNNPYVIGGQGTIGIEIFEELENLNALLIPLSGGGLFAGISIAAKAINPKIKCYGVQTEACPVMFASLKAGKLVDIPMEDSIAEGLHGGVEKGSVTFEYVQNYCEEVLLVNEDEIKTAIIELIREHHMICEGAGAVGLAAIKRYSEIFRDKTVAIVISGSNLDFIELEHLMCNN